MLDITDDQALKQYVINKELASKPEDVSTRELGGGVSCSVVKVTTPKHAFVLKQALPKLKVQEDWFADIQRIFTEAACLKVCHELVPDAVPDLLFTDDDHYLLAMEAAPEGVAMWKSQLLSGRIDFQTGQKVVRALIDIHNATYENDEIEAKFEDKDIFIQLRIDPYLRTVAERHPSLKKAVDEEIEYILSMKQTLVHGDYSPKNILVEKERIYILDFEVAHFGDPAFDVAFLSNHLLLKSIKHKQWAAAYLNLLTYMTGIYFRSARISAPELEKHTLKVLAFLFLARVDGKSPVEYITAEQDKQLIRKLSYKMISNNIQTFQELRELVEQQVSFVNKA